MIDYMFLYDKCLETMKVITQLRETIRTLSLSDKNLEMIDEPLQQLQDYLQNVNI